MNKIKTLYYIVSQNGINAGLKAIINKLRLTYYQLFVGSDHMMVTVHGERMYVNTSQKGISSTLAIWGIREPCSTFLVENELSEGDTVVDIGANIGYYTLIMSSEVGPSGTVYSIEPTRSTFELLKKNVDSRGYHNRVELFNLAIADYNGEIELSIVDRDNLNQIAMSSSKETQNTINVPCRTLDHLLENKKEVDFIRMDLEGYESVVLSDSCMGDIIRNCNPTILFESHSNYGQEMEQNLCRLFNLGYYTAALVSEYQPRPDQLINRGYEPKYCIPDQDKTLGIYYNIDNEDTIQMLVNEKHTIRDVLLKHPDNDSVR